MPEENEFLANFTCRYLSFMDTDVAELVYYPTIDSAVQAWLPDGYSHIVRLYAFGRSGLKDYGSATLRCKI